MPSQTIVEQPTEKATAPRNDIRAAIKRFPLFAALPTATQEQLVHLLEVEVHPVKALIFRFNDPGDVMYFLCEGSVRFVARDYTGREVELEEIQRGDLFGEVALYTGGERTADAIATSPATLLLLRRENMNEFLRSCPEVSEYLLARMASRLSTSNRLLRRAHVSVEDVVANNRSPEDRVLKRMVEFFATMPFLIVNVVFTIAWLIAGNLLDRFGIKIDTEGFDRLSLILGIDSLLVSIMVLMNQAREAKEEGVRDRAEYDSTMHTENSIRYLHEKIDTLGAELHRFRIEQSGHSHDRNGHNHAP